MNTDSGTKDNAHDILNNVFPLMTMQGSLANGIV